MATRMNGFPTVAAIQTVPARGDIAGNAVRHAELVRMAAKHGAALALFPELSLTGYEAGLARELAMHTDDGRLQELRDLARELRMTIVVGAPLIGETDAVLIGALSFLPDGRLTVYTKQHLHPGEEKVFTPGRGGDALDIDGMDTALAVCADFTHESHAQQAAAAGAALYAASVLISVGGYGTDIPILSGHAKRFAMPVLMANFGGPTGGWISAGRSAFWDAEGNEVVAAPSEGECIVLATRRPDGWHGEAVATVTPGD
jgi:predicted amidohydrolase